MKILVACEFSGVVRRAFRALGHDAWSCDLLPSEDNSQFHMQGDVLELLEGDRDWDLMIAHPPCTYLCNSGVRWLYKKDGSMNESRWIELKHAAAFFRALWQMPETSIKRIAIENPVMHKHASEKVGARRDQVIQPYQFGHGETKATCLWLKNLPPLKPTNIVSGRNPRVHHASPGPDRWKERSRTLPGVAQAMAEQWGGLPIVETRLRAAVDKA